MYLCCRNYFINYNLSLPLPPATFNDLKAISEVSNIYFGLHNI